MAMRRREFLHSAGAALGALALAPVMAQGAERGESGATPEGAGAPVAEAAPPAVAVPRDPYGWWDSAALDRAAARSAFRN